MSRTLIGALLADTFVRTALGSSLRMGSGPIFDFIVFASDGEMSVHAFGPRNWAQDSGVEICRRINPTGSGV